MFKLNLTNILSSFRETQIQLEKFLVQNGTEIDSLQTVLKSKTTDQKQAEKVYTNISTLLGENE